MAENYEQFSNIIPVDTAAQAEELCALIEKTSEYDEENDFVCLLTHCQVHLKLDINQYGVFIAGEEGLHEDIPEIIHEFYKKYDIKYNAVISAAYTCSKLRPDEFGGWAVGINKNEIYYVDAGLMVLEHLER